MKPSVQETTSSSHPQTGTPLLAQCGYAVGVLSRDFAFSMWSPPLIRSLERVVADYGLTELM